MNHVNLSIIVDVRKQHPYGVHRRLQFFAHKANVTLVSIPQRDKHITKYAITRS